MANPKVRMYREQSFGHLKGLAGISDRQIAEHPRCMPATYDT